MSEASGTILIKAPEEVFDTSMADDWKISWHAMESLARYAGIESLADCHAELAHTNNEMFALEGNGLERKNDFKVLNIFGQEWMAYFAVLVTQGNDIEIYGTIFDEYGQTEYYALNDDGERFHGVHDAESDDSDSKTEAHDEWVSLVPAQVLEEFEYLFETDSGYDEDDEDDYDEDEDDDY